MDYFNVQDKKYLVFGIANKKSVAYFIAQSLIALGAEVILSVLNNEIKQMRLTKQSEEIMKYKQEVSEVLAQINKAKTDEERKKLSLDLALKLGR